MPDGPQVRRMFARIAPRYDRANHLLSAGVDRKWRRAAAREAGLGGASSALDVCTGTGDLAFALARSGARVVGSDFCREMLVRARRKSGRGGARGPAFVAGDAQELPFPDASFDAVTVAFGIRNVSDPQRALREMKRVTRPGGRVVVLEFAIPRAKLLARLYLLYFRRILPLLGRWITGDRDGAYGYLPASVLAFPEREQFIELMRGAGLESPRCRVLTGGIAALYRAEVRR